MPKRVCMLQAVFLLLKYCNNYMIFRISFLVVASVAVFTVARKKINCPMSQKTPNTKFSEKNDTNFKQVHEEEVVQSPESKAIDELELNESEGNGSSSEFQLHNRDWNCVIEIEMLKDVVKKMERRRVSLEVKLLELYCSKQQQLNIAQLRKDLKLKIVEIDMLNATINSLQTEKIRLGEEIIQNQLAEKELERATKRLIEMQKKKYVESAQIKRQLMMVEEQLWGFKMKETDGFKDDKFEEKIRGMKNVELEGVELKRKNTELQLEMRELTVKLVAAQTRINELSNMTQSKIIAKAKEEIITLRHSNEVLLEQVEKLQQNKFSTVEGLVYQRWLNACLRSEIQEHRTPQKCLLNRKLSKKLCFESQESANTSSLESDEISSTTTTSHSSSRGCIKKKYSLIRNIKKWGRRKDDSIQKGLIRRFSMPNVPSDASTRAKNQVNIADSVEVPNVPGLRRVSFSDTIKPAEAMDKEPYNEQITSAFNNSSGLKQNQVFGFSEPSKARRLRRVSFSDLVKPATQEFCDVTKSMDRKTDIMNGFYNSTGELEERKNETFSGGPSSNDQIENQVINKNEAVDSLSERKVCAQLMDIVAAGVIFLFFILLLYLFLASINY